eukprot:TRINITY_DN23326_c0_g1_i1.p1 TRINITY_DN23326_c0_g1~~TRINITY_DN23326_c0_g1_i1.p1  ORF type:complete len:688 (+),score=99.19 TRINITY_DN23326_c0_g1_i1:142-2205(+)
MVALPHVGNAQPASFGGADFHSRMMHVDDRERDRPRGSEPEREGVGLPSIPGARNTFSPPYRKGSMEPESSMALLRHTARMEVQEAAFRQSARIGGPEVGGFGAAFRMQTSRQMGMSARHPIPNWSVREDPAAARNPFQQIRAPVGQPPVGHWTGLRGSQSSAELPETPLTFRGGTGPVGGMRMGVSASLPALPSLPSHAAAVSSSATMPSQRGNPAGSPMPHPGASPVPRRGMAAPWAAPWEPAGAAVDRQLGTIRVDNGNGGSTARQQKQSQVPPSLQKQGTMQPAANYPPSRSASPVSDEPQAIGTSTGVELLQMKQAAVDLQLKQGAADRTGQSNGLPQFPPLQHQQQQLEQQKELLQQQIAAQQQLLQQQRHQQRELHERQMQQQNQLLQQHGEPSSSSTANPLRQQMEKEGLAQLAPSGQQQQLPPGPASFADYERLALARLGRSPPKEGGGGGLSQPGSSDALNRMPGSGNLLPGNVPSGSLPPGHLPPGSLPPGNLPPGKTPSGNHISDASASRGPGAGPGHAAAHLGSFSEMTAAATLPGSGSNMALPRPGHNMQQHAAAPEQPVVRRIGSSDRLCAQQLPDRYAARAPPSPQRMPAQPFGASPGQPFGSAPGPAAAAAASAAAPHMQYATPMAGGRPAAGHRQANSVDCPKHVRDPPPRKTPLRCAAPPVLNQLNPR